MLTFPSYFESSKYSDLVIRCEGQEFKVHKIVVCGQSKYFSVMCDGDWKVRLEDIKSPYLDHWPVRSRVILMCDYDIRKPLRA